MTQDLLSPWHGPAEVAFVEALSVFPLPVPIPEIWDAARCPVDLLPHLAWALDAEDFDTNAPDDTQREVIASAVTIHRQRGTLAGVRRALGAAGFGTATIIERFGEKVYDTTVVRDGTSTRVAADHWAEFRVILDRPVTIAQAAQARAVIGRAGPARSHLKALDYREAPHLHNAVVPRDGTYARGLA